MGSIPALLKIKPRNSTEMRHIESRIASDDKLLLLAHIDQKSAHPLLPYYIDLTPKHQAQFGKHDHGLRFPATFPPLFYRII
jgi:hypothetical protein